jgi:vacuolar-type H+-ATPase subunit C/Vma6
MIRSAKDYGALNVRMRAQRMKLLTVGNYNTFVAATDIKNLRQMLMSTPYGEAVNKELKKKYPDLIALDQNLIQLYADQFKFYEKFVPERSKSFIEAFGQRFFLDDIKYLLSALYGLETQQESVRKMLIALTEEENRQIESLYASQNISELIQKITIDELQKQLEAAFDEYVDLNLVYPLTNAVDNYYYQRICEEVRNLSKSDRKPTRAIFGTQIDLQNIETILRSKYFDLPLHIVEKWLIKRIGFLKERHFDNLLEATSVKEALNYIKEKTPYRDLANQLLTNLTEDKPALDGFDYYTDQLVAHKANETFLGNSFNIATFPAFFILKEFELRNIRAIILGKIDKRPRKSIFESLILV